MNRNSTLDDDFIINVTPEYQEPLLHKSYVAKFNLLDCTYTLTALAIALLHIYGLLINDYPYATSTCKYNR